MDVAGFNFDLSIVTVPERRNGASVRTEWIIQPEMEALLYGSTFTTGACYRLLQRAKESSGIDVSTLTLRSSSVQSGLVTADEWATIGRLMSPGARLITLVPRSLALAALEVFGKEPVSVAVIQALNEQLPADWRSDGW